MGSAAEVAAVPGRGHRTENLIPVFIDYKLKKSPLSKRAWFWGWACLDNAALRSERGITPVLCTEFNKMVFLKLKIDSEKKIVRKDKEKKKPLRHLFVFEASSEARGERDFVRI